MEDLDARIATLKKAAADTESQLPEVSATTVQSATPEPWWTPGNAMTISSVTLLFGLAVILITGWLVGRGQRPDALLRLFGTIVIIIAAVFLVVAGYSDKQIAPVMGLLGTIAGYLLGKDTAPPAPAAAAAAPPPTPPAADGAPPAG